MGQDGGRGRGAWGTGGNILSRMALHSCERYRIKFRFMIRLLLESGWRLKLSSSSSVEPLAGQEQVPDQSDGYSPGRTQQWHSSLHWLLVLC